MTRLNLDFETEEDILTRTDISETAELIGISAIVASLIALVVELPQRQSALVAQTYQAKAIDAMGELITIADSGYLAPILTATSNAADLEAVANFSAGDRLRLFNFLRARMIDWDNEHYQYQHGFLDADFFAATTEKSVKAAAPRWRNVGLTDGREDFRRYIDTVLSESLTGR